MIVDRALIFNSMEIPGSSGSLQVVDHTQIDSPYYKGHCKVVLVISTIYSVIICNVRGASQMLPDPDWRLKTREELKLVPAGATTMKMTTKGEMCLVRCSKRSPTEDALRKKTRRRSQTR